MSRFYTLGLPRSRSAWLSVFLTDEHADCFHEALTPFGSARMPESRKAFKGSADTNPLNPVARSGRLAIIERPLDQCIQSMLKGFDNPFQDREFEPFVTAMATAYKQRLDQFSGSGVIRVQFDALNDPEQVCRLADFLRPGTKASRKRAVSLVETVVITKNRDLMPGIISTARHYRLTIAGLYQAVIDGRLK